MTNEPIPAPPAGNAGRSSTQIALDRKKPHYDDYTGKKFDVQEKPLAPPGKHWNPSSIQHVKEEK